MEGRDMEVTYDLTGVTGCQITLSCKDPRTMSTLARAFEMIGECMARAAERARQRENYRRELPAMKAKAQARNDVICNRIKELVDLEYNALVKQVLREFNESWDYIALLASETRNASRAARIRERNERILSDWRAGRSAAEIAREVNLTPGTVRNIVSRLNRTTGRNDTLTVGAS